MVCQSWCVTDLPRHHSSSPCKPSCSEPQRTLLSVELRILSFFNMLASMFLVFSKLCLSSISYFFQTFSYVPTVFPEFPSCNFLIFPTVSSISLVFPSGFSKLAIDFFLQFKGCFTIFHFPLFLTIFLHFPWFFPTFFLLCSRDLGGIEPYRHQIA